MAFQLSPGVLVTEEDRTTIVPSVATTAGALSGAFKWGPVDEVVTIDTENNLVERFGKPDDTTANYFFTAANFLSYGNNLKIVRTVDKSIAKNSVSTPSGKVTSIQVLSTPNTFTTSDTITVTVDAPGGTGTTATAQAVLKTSGNVLSVTVDSSAFGYSVAPDIGLNGGGGTNATAEAVLGGGRIANITLLSSGNNYVTGSNIVIQNQDSTSAFANLQVHFKITGIEISDGDYVGYNANSNIVLEGGLVSGGTVATAEPVIGYLVGNIYVLDGGSGYDSNANVALEGGELDDWNEPGLLEYFQPDDYELTLDSNTGAILSVALANLTYNGFAHYRSTPNVIINRNGSSGSDADIVVELLDISGEIKYVNITNNGNGYISVPNVIVNRNFPGLQGLDDIPLTANLGYGYIDTITLVNPGEGGYAFTPNVVINRNNPDAPGDSANAEISVRIAAQIQEIIITDPGAGYTSAPEVTISENVADTGLLSGTSAANVTLGFEIDRIDIVNEGAGYTSAPDVTVVSAANITATANAQVTPTSLLIENLEVYKSAYEVGGLNLGEFASKYPGTIGNSILVSMADSATFSTWRYQTLFDAAPSTSASVASRSGSNDEIHVIIIDATGEISGVAGTVLEKFSFVSKSRDAKNSDGSTNYYKDVINNGSKFVYVLDHPISTTNWGGASTTSFDSLTANVTSTLTGGVDGNQVSSANILAGFNYFSNDELYDVSLIPMGPTSTTSVVNSVISIAENRRDCMVFVSPPYEDVVNVLNQATNITEYRDTLTNSSYAVLDSGWKYQYDRYNDKYRYVPLNGDTAGLAARTDYIADPWFSPAGYNRGVIKNVVKLAYSPSKTDRDTLYKKGVNPVVTFPGQGTLLFGDKTLLARPSAFDRINVRRLFIVLEKAIATASKFQLFEFNDAFTRAQFRNLVEPFLRDVQGRRGVTDFRVICDETNNTDEIVDRNEFVADIFIKPARAINYIQLNFIATRSGVSFEEVGA